MPTTYLTPGVYVEEVPSASKPIEGVGTSICAFVGFAPGGPINTPMRISNWSQFVRLYTDTTSKEAEQNGPFMEGAYLAHSVYGFFANGGTVCWVVRVGTGAEAPTAQAALPSMTDASLEMFRVLAPNGADGAGVTVEVTEEPPEGPKTGEGSDAAPEPSYKVVVTAPGSDPEEFGGVSAKKGRNYIVTKVNAASKLIKLEDTGASLPDAARVLAPGTYKLSVPAIPVGEMEPEMIAGDVARRQGMGALSAIDEVTMVCAPDLQAFPQNGGAAKVRDLQGKMIAHCENMGDRMAILDPPPDLIPQEILDWRMNEAGYDSKFATLYWPWLEVMDPLTGQPKLVPPSGHVAGVWARTDGGRGVHKAPANEVVMATNGLAFQITHEEQGALNQVGINCIRSFPGRGIRIWGARTLSSDPEWRYLNVRRLFNFIAESINEGTQWSVFEPNDARLWMQLRIAASNFLTRVWRNGALFGATPEQAFYVKCDEETNPPENIEAGQVTVEIGIAPVKPAEFVVFRISQYTAGATEVTA
jgi:uncharacterized protein